MIKCLHYKSVIQYVFIYMFNNLIYTKPIIKQIMF